MTLRRLYPAVFVCLRMKKQSWALFCLVLLLSFSAASLRAQSTNAAINGQITDAQGRDIPGTAVHAVNIDTNVAYPAKTNDSGIYVIAALPPGRYRLVVLKDGFKEINKTDIVLHVQDILEQNFSLEIGSTSESITVSGSDANVINTTDGSVSTVIDSKFVENTPLNGRSFQSLILLTPGVVTNTPQSSSVLGQTGEFAVNGQRTESNYYTVDGVSANSGIAAGNPGGAGTGGALPASTELGTTQGLVSVDALQEFRVESSTYSAEYGRSPGGQFSMVTRSGTNDWHGTSFNYFRNDVLDSNNWFNDNTVPITPKTPERQNDFGGTLGGPIRIPHLYNGKNRSFFFFSYEGLRLTQPVPSNVNYVPTLALRASAPGPLQQALDAFPKPSSGAPDLGNGLSEFISAWSTPSQLDATSIRLDHNLGDHTHLFLRFSGTPSSTITRGMLTTGNETPSSRISSTNSTYTYTLGVTSRVASLFDNDFRLNYASTKALNQFTMDDFGGATPVNLSQLQGTPTNIAVQVVLRFPGYRPAVGAANTAATQRQWNLVDIISFAKGKHNLRAGVDWRRLAPTIRQPNSTSYQFLTTAAVAANSVGTGLGIAKATAYPIYDNFSLFVQDEWRATQALNVSLGLRWDVNPAPGVSQGLMPYTIVGINDYSTMSLAPQGTSLYRTTWYNLAPRLGLAYRLDSTPALETVIRGGAGVFFDTGQQAASNGFIGPGFLQNSSFGTTYGIPASFPVGPTLASPAITQPPTAPYSTVSAFSPHLQLPYTLQWNVSLEQSLGRSQSFTMSYVGANGRKLLEEQEIYASPYNSQFTYIDQYANGLTSNYNALEVKFQRQVARGLQTLASYTWSHSLDYGSYNVALPYQYGNSDFDLRHNATAAVSYDLPINSHLSWSKVLTSGWGTDGRLTARTGFPVTLSGNSVTDPTNGETYNGGLNLVPNTPLYLYASRSLYPGGRRVNPAAFSLPTANSYGDAPRNFVRGFGATQIDVALRKTFPIHDSVGIQFRAEAFNVLNHPNFGYVYPYYGGVQFGEATQLLSQSLGTLSPLYQMGGPRSLQLSLRLTF